jgi:hypothetical protein
LSLDEEFNLIFVPKGFKGPIAKEPTLVGLEFYKDAGGDFLVIRMPFTRTLESVAQRHPVINIFIQKGAGLES